MRIRLAEAPDFAATLDFYHEISDAMVGTPHDCAWRRGVHPSDEFIDRLVRDGGMLLAEDDSGLAGAVGFDNDLGHDYGPLPWRVDIPDAEAAVVHLLAVKQALRGQGLSRKLLRACIEEVRARGMRSLRLDATVNNAPAIALYESEGFVRVGEGVQHIGPADNPDIRLVVMELVL